MDYACVRMRERVEVCAKVAEFPVNIRIVDSATPKDYQYTQTNR